jgi:hypothetical protein
MAMNMLQIAQAAIDQMPPASRFNADDGRVILAHQEFLLALEPAMITFFYDTLFDHPPTAEVFVEDERPAREVTLSEWWRRTVTGPLDAPYFAWMARVGLAHVFRGVTNPMMLAMASLVATWVAEQARRAPLSHADAAALAGAFTRLAGTVGVVITHAYDESTASALSLARVRALTGSTRSQLPPGAPATA